MLHAGLDLSRKRVDVRVLYDAGDTALETWTPADRDGLSSLVRRVAMFDEPVRGVIEAMNGARFVHDHLEQLGWDIEIADAARVKGLAPLACKTDRIDAWVLAELSRRDLVPAIWLPSPGVRGGRGTGPLATASGQAPHRAQEPGAFDPDRVRLSETGVGSLRGRRARPARGPRVPRTVALEPGRGAATHRRARRRHHRLWNATCVASVASIPMSSCC